MFHQNAETPRRDAETTKKVETLGVGDVGEARRRRAFARALVALEMRVERAPSPAFRELARLAHARLLTGVDDDARFFLLARRIAKTKTKTKTKTETETSRDPDASPAMRALYVSRLRRWRRTERSRFRTARVTRKRTLRLRSRARKWLISSWTRLEARYEP